MYDMVSHRLDRQNRLTIPQKIRTAWRALPDFDGRFCLYPIKSALRASTLENYALLEQKLLTTQDPVVRRQARFILGNAMECRLDKRGRMLVSRFMIEFLSPSQKKVWLIIKKDVLDIYSQNPADHYLKERGPIDKDRMRCLFYYEKMIKMRIDTIIKMHEHPESGMLENEFRSIFYHNHLELLPLLEAKETIEYIIGIHRKEYTEALHISIDKNTCGVVVSDIEAFTGILKKTDVAITSMLHARRPMNNNVDQISEVSLRVRMTPNNTRTLNRFFEMAPARNVSKGISSICFFQYLIDEILVEIDALEARACMEVSYDYGKILKRNRLGMTQMLACIRQTLPMADEPLEEYAHRLKKSAGDFRTKSRDLLVQTEGESYFASWNSGARTVEDTIVSLLRSSETV